MRFEKIKNTQALRRRSMHNLRIGKLPAHIDEGRTKLNQASGNAVEEFKKASKGVKMRKNGVIAVELVLSFSKGSVGEKNMDKWTNANLAWVAQEFGGDNIIEAALHLDEKVPHMHVIFTPRVKGKWNCRELLGGKVKCHRLQDSYAVAMEEFGLKRGERKKGRRHIPVEEYRKLDQARKREKNIMCQQVADYLGKDGYHKFLKFTKNQKRIEKEIRGLEARKMGNDSIGLDGGM